MVSGKRSLTTRMKIGVCGQSLRIRFGKLIVFWKSHMCVHAGIDKLRMQIWLDSCLVKNEFVNSEQVCFPQQG